MSSAPIPFIARIVLVPRAKDAGRIPHDFARVVARTCAPAPYVRWFFDNPVTAEWTGMPSVPFHKHICLCGFIFAERTVTDADLMLALGAPIQASGRAVWMAVDYPQREAWAALLLKERHHPRRELFLVRPRSN